MAQKITTVREIKMESDRCTLEALLKRVNHLENRSSRLVLCLILACSVILVAGLSGADNGTVPEKIKAQAFHVAGSEGELRAQLSHGDNETELALHTSNGRIAMTMRVNDDGVGLGLADDNGKKRVEVSVSKDGPAIYCCDADAKTRFLV